MNVKDVLQKILIFRTSLAIGDNKIDVILLVPTVPLSPLSTENRHEQQDILLEYIINGSR